MSNVTRIKICGIKHEADAQVAIDCGADALGFNFVPDTPRYIGDRPDLIPLLTSLPPFVTRVGVCVHPDHIPPEWRDYLDLLQVYEYTEQVRETAGKDLLPAFRIRDEAGLDTIATVLEVQRPRGLLLDAYHEHALGGTGVVFDWSLAVAAKTRFGLPIILAGGLKPENVASAIAAVRPYAVDVSSGVEAEPGRKDHIKLKAFCEAVRSV